MTYAPSPESCGLLRFPPEGDDLVRKQLLVAVAGEFALLSERGKVGGEAVVSVTSRYDLGAGQSRSDDVAPLVEPESVEYSVLSDVRRIRRPQMGPPNREVKS